MKTLACLTFLLITILDDGSGQFAGNRADNPSSQVSNGLSCPERNGRSAHESQCDAYIECQDGVAEEKLCPDGLLFNPNAKYFSYPCQYPIDVDCGGRSVVQPARATEECPHSYGYFKVGDSASCGQFKNCVDGRGYIFDCPLGLAFNEETLQCDWPDQVASCDAEAYLGFTCPTPDGAFSSTDFRLHRSPSGCSKYFVCINGKPRLLACPEGQGFNDETGTCDDEENVPGCTFEPSREPVTPILPPPQRRRLQKRTISTDNAPQQLTTVMEEAFVSKQVIPLCDRDSSLQETTVPASTTEIISTSPEEPATVVVTEI